ncbi:hypothetical protein [Nonomuraea sp. GTA35]
MLLYIAMPAIWLMAFGILPFVALASAGWAWQGSGSCRCGGAASCG